MLFTQKQCWRDRVKLTSSSVQKREKVEQNAQENIQLSNALTGYHASKSPQEHCKGTQAAGYCHLTSFIVSVDIVVMLGTQRTFKDRNILACCMVFTESQSGSEGSGAHEATTLQKKG